MSAVQGFIMYKDLWRNDWDFLLLSAIEGCLLRRVTLYMYTGLTRSSPDSGSWDWSASCHIEGLYTAVLLLQTAVNHLQSIRTTHRLKGLAQFGNCSLTGLERERERDDTGHSRMSGVYTVSNGHTHVHGSILCPTDLKVVDDLFSGTGHCVESCNEVLHTKTLGQLSGREENDVR